MEFGSEINFNFDDICSNPNQIFQNFENYHTYLLESRRSALNLILTKLKNKFKKVLLPSYICKDVYNCFIDFDKKIFYQIDENFEVKDFSVFQNIKEPTIVFVSNYFGISEESTIFKLLQTVDRSNIFIIYDITHSFFNSQKNMADAYVVSIRKWASIPDGGILFLKNKIREKLKASDNELVMKKIEATILKSIYLKNDTNINLNNIYREDFCNVEKIFASRKKYCIRKMSVLSENYIRFLDIERMKKRLENYKVLFRLINNKKIKFIFNDDVVDKIPFVFPILCNERDKLREYLNENQIYCAIHWVALESYNNDKIVNKISSNILSIPIDQRYETCDMVYIAKIINSF